MVQQIQVVTFHCSSLTVAGCSVVASPRDCSLCVPGSTRRESIFLFWFFFFFQTEMQYLTAFIIIKMQRSLFRYLKIHVKTDVVPGVVVNLYLSFQLPSIHASVGWAAKIKIWTDSGCQWHLYTLTSNLTPQNNCKPPLDYVICTVYKYITSV